MDHAVSICGNKPRWPGRLLQEDEQGSPRRTKAMEQMSQAMSSRGLICEANNCTSIAGLRFDYFRFDVNDQPLCAGLKGCSTLASHEFARLRS